MAMAFDAFVGIFVNRLGVLLEEEIVMQIGVDAALTELKVTLTDLQVLFADAESKKLDVFGVYNWLARLRNLMYDADDIIDDCRVEAEKHAASGRQRISSTSKSRIQKEIGKRIQSIHDSLTELNEDVGLAVKVQPPSVPRKILQTSPIMVESEIVGIDDDTSNLANLLTGGNTRRDKCPVYAITGMPGIGKTTLAQKVVNDRSIKSHFEAVIWLSVSKYYNEVDLLKEITGSLVPNISRFQMCGHIKTRADMNTAVNKLVENKRFLLVLDDIWDGKVWDVLKCSLQSAANDSKVLVTTRNEAVAKEAGAIYTHQIQKLPDKYCWEMLCKMMFDEDDEPEVKTQFKSVGMQIVGKCKGLPLTVKTIGGLLRTQIRTIEAWELIRDSRTWDTHHKHKIEPVLLLSYEDLPSHLKQCFIYCSLFPEGFRFNQQNLVLLWIAEGFVGPENENTSLEQLGEDYYRELVIRNMLPAASEYYDGKGCTMHDLFRSFALYVSRNDQHSVHNPTEIRCMSYSDQSVITGGIYNHECLRTLFLSRNPLLKSIPSDLFDKLRRLRVLDLSYTGIYSLPDTVGNLIFLRFLNVAFTNIEKLPQTVQNLQLLETLKANGYYLRKLPSGIVHLKNLRHLTVGTPPFNLIRLPTGIRALMNLRTFYGFVPNNGNGNGMNELESLSKLREITMFRLDLVTSKAEAEKAVIAEKTELKYLRLSCTRKFRTHQSDEGEIKRIEDVYEGLNPPSNVEAIHIESYFGRELPSSFRNCSLCKLTWLKIEDCKYMWQLPALGDLPGLDVLIVSGLTAISEITSGFFGSNGFPKLTQLFLWKMRKLVKISALQPGMLPKLKILHIIRCPKLLSLPAGLHHAEDLIEMAVEESQSIKVIENLISVLKLKLRSNSKLKKLAGIPLLCNLSIKNCPHLNDVQCTNRLINVVLSDDKMVALPEWLLNASSLKQLHIKGDAALVSRCRQGCSEWPKIEHIHEVEASCHDGSTYASN